MYKKQLTQKQVEEAKANRAKAVERMKNGIKDVFESGQLEAVLKSRGHGFSFLNTIGLYCQCPKGSDFRGFRDWQKVNRYVRKGEHGFQILAPTFKKIKVEANDAESDKFVKMLRGFRVVYVFDISQTDGLALPAIVNPLDSISDKTAWLISRLRQISPMPVSNGDTKTAARGYTDYSTNEIMISDTLTGNDELKTLIHEITHATFHTSGNDRQLKEILAEAVAFTVCENYGIDSSVYSVGYVVSWLNTIDKEHALECFAKVGEEIIRASQYIIDAIDGTVELERIAVAA